MLPDASTFVRDAESIEGMMSRPSMAVFYALLDLQLRTGVKGDIIEFGVYKGRSAATLLHGLRDDEKAYLVDINPRHEVEKLTSINPNFEFIHGKSEAIAKTTLQDQIPARIRFSHHDASHFFDNVSGELAFIEPKLVDDPIVVLDDFGNPGYWQVVAAAFHYLYATGSDLEMFLITANKAYLCRKKHFDKYARFVLDDLPSTMAEITTPHMVSRTDKGAKFRAFGLTPKRAPSDPDRYGIPSFGTQFYEV